MTLFRKPKIDHFPKSPSTGNSPSEVAFGESIPICQNLKTVTLVFVFMFYLLKTHSER